MTLSSDPTLPPNMQLDAFVAINNEIGLVLLE